MKFAIAILLACCAIYAQTSPVPGFGDFFDTSSVVREDIEAFIEKAKQTYEEAVKKLNEYVNKAQEQLQRFMYEGKVKLQSIYDEFQKKLEELKHQDEVVKGCVEKYEPELEKIEEEAKADLQQCYDNAAKATKDIREKVNGDVEVLKSKTEEFTKLVKECLSFNPITVAKCAHNNWDKFTETMKEIASGSQNVYQETVEAGSEIIKDAYQCSKEVYEKTKEKVNEVDEKVRECTDNSN